MSKVTHLTPERGNGAARQTGDSGEGEISTGQALRAARLRRGEDIAAVSRVLRIRKDHLEAIEADRLEELPGRTYAIGFVRSYAEHIGLEPAGLVERFKRESAGRGDAAPQIGVLSDPDPEALPYGWIMIAVLVALVVIYGGYYLFRSARTQQLQPVAAVPAQMTAAGTQPRPSPGRRQPHPVLAHQPARPATGASPPAAGFPPAAVAYAGLPQGQTLGMGNKDVRVILHARSATHVLVQGPGGKVYLNRILHPGDAYRVPNLVGLSLTTPDGGAVSVELDGQDTGRAGGTGQMTEALSLDPQAIVDRASAGRHG